MKKIIIPLPLLCLYIFLFTPSFCDDNTVDLRISNAYTDNRIFIMDVEIRRTSSWPFTVPNVSYDDLLWNGDLQFSYNPLGFLNEPTFTNLNTGLSTSEYNITVTHTGIALTFAITGPQAATTTMYKPPLNEWDQICTIEWDIADPDQSSGIEWSTSGTGLISAAGFGPGNLVNSYYGSGNISLLSADPPAIISNKILQVSPNPFSPQDSSVNFFITAPSSGLLELNVYNMKGQLINVLYQDNVQTNQDITLSWNGVDSLGNELPSGVYLYRLLVDNKSYDEQKIVIIR